jgi:hypothetical protein
MHMKYETHWQLFACRLRCLNLVFQRYSEIALEAITG